MVIAATDDLAVFYDDRPDGDFTGRGRLRGKIEGGTHETFFESGEQPYSHSIVAGGLLEMS